MLLATVVALNPVGLEFLRSAFFAGEQLARNIAQPIVLTAMAILASDRRARMAGQGVYYQSPRSRRNNCLS